MKSKYIRIPFDLDKAKLIANGKLKGRIVTEKGREIRIICFDRANALYPIIALRKEKHKKESIVTFTKKGEEHDGGKIGSNLHLEVPTCYKDYSNFEPIKNQPCLVRDGEEDVWWVQVCAGKNAVGDVMFYTDDGGTETWVEVLPLSKATERLIGTTKSYDELCAELDADNDQFCEKISENEDKSEKRSEEGKDKGEETWLDRLKTEFKDLYERKERLVRFMNRNAFNELPSEERDLMHRQLTIMWKYIDVLSTRLSKEDQNDFVNSIINEDCKW